jgi:hypothetical protein
MLHYMLALGITMSPVLVPESIINLPQEIFLTISRSALCLHLLPPFLIYSQYGVTVTESSAEIRNAFVRKVYTILCASPSTTLLDGANVPVLCCSGSNREFSRMHICLDLTRTYASWPPLL